ncbi:MAG: hypothetical protein EOP56_07995 [Sphingobacteriales bacterium]|nr:MAG: hypothetical protein EOP56_07995 [Sphingobacteriales bacterium]
MKKITVLALSALITSGAYAQGTLSGDLMANVNFFQRDTAIKAANNPLYDNYLSGGEAWLSLRYYNNGFTATVRADAFHNSNLYNPTQALTNFGVGAWSLSKEFKRLTITGGYIYDQIGSGILFRAYEDRGLLIDNALVGLHLKFQPTDNITVKAFTGQQKFLFERYRPVIKGINVEGGFDVGKNKNIHLSPGVGAVNRTLDQTSMDLIVNTINNQDFPTRFIPKYNMYAFTAYNTLTLGSVSWYAEGSYKTEDVIVRDNILQHPTGTVLYSTLGYAQKGLAVNLTGKRTDNFVMRTSPNEVLIRGLMNWQPIVARLRPQRLMARYTPASQDLSEVALGSDVLISPSDNLDLTFNYTHINTIEDIKLYREAYAEAEYRGFEKWVLQGGVQVMEYNQELYQVKPAVPIIQAITPFAEITYRFNDKHSIRTQLEYQHTKQDFGSWAFALVEYNVAPKLSFALSDMYNIDPGPAASGGSQHYYNIFTAYTQGPHRFTASYVKQVEGINCTGGVCRYEPAFSGMRFGITSSF